ncbi:MAG TPA: biotin/lipoate A/B protein ligase family protein [Nitrososphaeraceae archaeon]
MKFNSIRLLETGFSPGSWNMALDEVLLTNCIDDNTPILRLYGWSPAAVSIGYFQSMDEEVNVDKCNDLGIEVVRRMTGGGAVLHQSELTYSFITKTYPMNILASYQLICDPVVMGINKLGFRSMYVPLNDILVNNKKVSGNAQTRKNNTLLQHGTILLNVDFDKMFSVLNVPSEKVKDKMLEDVKSRVMALNKTFEEVAYNLKESFSEKFNAQFILGGLTDKEKKDTKKLASEKYSAYQWNWKR